MAHRILLASVTSTERNLRVLKLTEVGQTAANCVRREIAEVKTTTARKRNGDPLVHWRVGLGHRSRSRTRPGWLVRVAGASQELEGRPFNF
jgi:hypothetical protein